MIIYCSFTCIVLLFTCFTFTSASSDPPLLRGIPLSKQTLYQPTGPFQCLDGSQTIPFADVNDDYCDCPDGSDEPGTSACNGVFYCQNAGYVPSEINSSRVNDGICDCCDGSDEYTDLVQCENTCEVLGRAAKEKEEKLKKLHEYGYKLRLDYAKQAADAIVEKKTRLSELEEEKNQLVEERDKLEAVKVAAETPEKEAKDLHQKAWDEQKAVLDKETDAKKAADAFAELDINSDNFVSVDEMQLHLEFDVDNNGEVSVDEAKEYLDGNDVVTVDQFKSDIWNNIKQLYKSTVAPDVPQPTPAPDMSIDESTTDEDDDEYKYDDDDDEAKDDHSDVPSHTTPPPIDESPAEPQMPEYDEDTKKLISTADEARKAYDEANDKVNTAENEITEIKAFLELDLGADGEFYPLKGQCFDLNDREYTYQLCPYEKAIQKPKDGYSETRLGSWGHWSGRQGSRYSEMTYDNGDSCWNGPNRSVKVVLSCGGESKLVSAREPSRCEYLFEFETPALCKQESNVGGKLHDEL